MPNYNNPKKYKCNNYPSCVPNNPQNNQGAPNSGNTNVPTWLITEKGLYSTTIKSAFNTHSRSASGNLQDKKGICISTRPKIKILRQEINKYGLKAGSPFGFGAPPRNSFI